MQEAFKVKTGKKQGFTLFPMLFNLAFQKTIRIFQKKSTGISIEKQMIQVLWFADDLNILGNS